MNHNSNELQQLIRWSYEGMRLYLEPLPHLAKLVLSLLQIPAVVISESLFLLGLRRESRIQRWWYRVAIEIRSFGIQIRAQVEGHGIEPVWHGLDEVGRPEEPARPPPIGHAEKKV